MKRLKLNNSLTNNQKTNNQSQIAAPIDFQVYFPREVIHVILQYSSYMLRLRTVSKLFCEVIDGHINNEGKSLFQRNIQCYLVNFIKSSNEQLIESESVLEEKNVYSLTHKLSHQITFLDTRTIRNFIGTLNDPQYLDPLLEAITFCDDINPITDLHKESSDEETSEESFEDFNDVVPDFLQALWDNKAKLPNLKKLSFGTLYCTLAIPPFDIEILNIKEIIGDKNEQPEPFCPKLQFAFTLPELKTLSCGLYNAFFAYSGQIFQDDGKDWDLLLPQLETLTFGNFNYAAIEEDDSESEDENDSEAEYKVVAGSISTKLVLEHQNLKHLDFKGVIESTVDLKDLPNLQWFYFNDINEEGLLRLSPSTLMNDSILAGLNDFSYRKNGEKFKDKTQKFIKEQSINGQIACELKFNQQKTLSTIQAIEEFTELLKSSDFADTSLDSIAVCDYVNPTLYAMESGDSDAFDDSEIFDNHFDNESANAYKNAVCSLLATLEVDMHKLSNLKAVSFGTVWFDLKIPAAFSKLETLIFNDIIGCSDKDYFPSIIFCEALKNLKTLLLGNLNNAFLKNGKRCFNVADWEIVFPSLSSLSVRYLMTDQWSFKHQHLEHLSFKGKLMSDITLSDLPNLKKFYLHELSSYFFLGLSGLSLSNDVILTGLFEYAKRQKEIICKSSEALPVSL